MVVKLILKTINSSFFVVIKLKRSFYKLRKRLRKISIIFELNYLIMKKLFLSALILGTLVSCNDDAKINECKDVSAKEIGNLDGFELQNAEYVSREGLKLAVDEEFESSTHIVSISYKNADDDYKGTSCYYGSDGKLMGSKSY